MIHDRVTVNRQIGELQQEVFTFWLDEYKMMLTLDVYLFQVRESKRHKWHTLQVWSRLNRRETNIERDAIALTEDIKQMALNEFIRKISIEE